MTAYDIIIKPVVTEQSMQGSVDKKYTFFVNPKANKAEIGKAIEEIFGVKVSKVNTVNYDGKVKRMGAGRPGRLQEGHRHPDRGLQDHRVLRRHGLREVTHHGD